MQNSEPGTQNAEGAKDAVPAADAGAVPGADAAAAPPARNRWWLVYLLLVFGMAIAGTVFLAVFNRSLQLTPDELGRWRAKWAADGPTKYKLGYFRKENDDPQGVYYLVKVRPAKLDTSATPIGGAACVHGLESARVGMVWQVLEDGRQLLPPGRWREFSMEGLFAMMQAHLDEDRQEGKPKVYTRSRFHSATGGVLEYVHRVMGSRTRLEISVHMYRFGKDAE